MFELKCQPPVIIPSLSRLSNCWRTERRSFEPHRVGLPQDRSALII